MLRDKDLLKLHFSLSYNIYPALHYPDDDNVATDTFIVLNLSISYRGVFIIILVPLMLLIRDENYIHTCSMAQYDAAVKIKSVVSQELLDDDDDSVLLRSSDCFKQSHWN